MSEMTKRTHIPANQSSVNKAHRADEEKSDHAIRRRPWWAYFTPYIPNAIRQKFMSFDRRIDGAASFFLKHAGKSRFMVAMSKKAQYLGIERLWYKGPKAFIYFFLFYLIRDTILYIVIPIIFAKFTS